MKKLSVTSFFLRTISVLNEVGLVDQAKEEHLSAVWLDFRILREKKNKA